jgi:UDP:flavonoid glycosyltransferase YjiC (YdhE family)
VAVARLGVGETLPARATPAAIRAAIDRLLADGPVRDAASALGRRLRAQHPGEAAVRVLEDAAHRVR